jgi:hypothetical protein
MLSPAGLGVLAEERRAELEARSSRPLAPHRTSSGAYILKNELHYLVARA